MKKIMRGVLLFGMLGGMLMSCGNNSEGSKTGGEKQKSQSEEKVFRIGLSQIVDHPALNDAKQGFKDALKKSGIKVEYDDKIANNEKLVPRSWVNREGNYVTREFIDYVEPLIQGDYQPFMVNGLPQHLALKR